MEESLCSTWRINEPTFHTKSNRNIFKSVGPLGKRGYLLSLLNESIEILYFDDERHCRHMDTIS